MSLAQHGLPGEHGIALSQRIDMLAPEEHDPGEQELLTGRSEWS